MTLDEVSDIETVRKAAKLLEAENQRLAQEVAKLRRELHALKGGDPTQLTLQMADLERQLGNLRRKIFGESTEKRPREKSGSAEASNTTGHGRRSQPQLPIVEQVHIASDADTICKACGGQLDVWNGQFEECEEIDVIERRFLLTKHRRQKYRCRCGQCIETAPGPRKLSPGARYSPKFAVTVAVDKYADHQPLERIVRTMSREGLEIDSQTLWDQINSLAHVIGSVHERLHQHVLSHPVVGVDETTWRLMGAKGKRDGGDGKKWQVWAVVSPDAVSYRILDSRSADAAQQVLGNYSGTILCDGYDAYQSLQKKRRDLRLAHCWAHVRRKFVEIEQQHPAACGEMLDLIGELYEVDRRAATGPPEQRVALRQEHAKPVIKRIQEWALATEALPQSGLGKAIAYMGGIWSGLQVFLEDPNVALDNNATERALRGVVIGRKNHYGSRSKRGIDVAALFYSLIESAKLVGVGPHTYLQTAVDAGLRGERIPLPHELA